jgi:hypothetical protein
MLGRRNCQRFLQTQFVLPKNNRLIADGIAGLSNPQKERFETSPPLTEDEKRQGVVASEKGWFPIVPLCSEELRAEAKKPARYQISDLELEPIVTAIYERLRVVAPALTNLVGSPFVRGPLKATEKALTLLGVGKTKLIEAIHDALIDPPLQH